MLRITGNAHSLCDGFTRRDLLRVGSLALGGFTLADLLGLRAEGATETRSHNKSVIMIFLSGGPSHTDTYDMKPNAAQEFRGEFRPIRTNVPGIEFCELMPMQARIADKLAILRGVKTVGNHTGNEFYSGFAFEQGKPNSVNNQQRPAVGSIVSKLRGSRNGMPAYVSLQDNPGFEQAYYLGSAHMPFRTVQRERANQGLANMRLAADMSRARLSQRQDLLSSFDNLRRDIDASGLLETLDQNNARALDIISSARVRDAFDLSKEPERIKSLYGSRPAAFDFIPGHELLLARRLVEAGVSVVTAAVHGWDTHENNFGTLRKQLPTLDQAVYGLITDLEQRGMLEDVTIIMGGEMGRTPRIIRGGRDHWPNTGITIMAGGGLKTGQIVGASDARGEEVLGRAITPQMLLASVYRTLGVNPDVTFPSTSGRPMYILDQKDAIEDLF